MDLKSIILFQILNGLVFTIGITLLWLYGRKQFNGVDKWMIAYIIRYAGTILVILRNVAPSFVSIVISNMLLALGLYILLIGLEEFLRLKSRHIHNVILLFLFSMVHIYFTYQKPNLLIRRMNIHLFYSAIFFQIAFLMLWRAGKKVKGNKIVGWTSAVFVLLHITGIVNDFIIPPGENIFNFHPIHTAQILLMLLTSSFFSLGLFLMVVGQQTKVLEDDIERIKKSEKIIQDSLKEKEILLKEIHHRVKNNLQMVSSILGIKSLELKEAEGKNIMNDCQSRVHSMAVIHEILYSSQNISFVEMNSYINMLIKAISNAYKKEAQNTIIDISVGDLSLTPKIAAILGLIITELLTNSFKYAFPGNKEGKIDIQLLSEDNRNYTLIIEDNGIGFDKDPAVHEKNSFGINLITDLAENKLNGNIKRFSNSGTKVIISFLISV